MSDENGYQETNGPEVAPPPPPPPPPPPAAQAPPAGFAEPPSPPVSSYAAPEPVVSDKNRVTAGVLGILLGWLGIHKFYLGYTQEGTLLLLLTLAGIVLSCVHLGWLLGWIPSVIGIVEGIIYLTKSDEEFQRTYVIGRKPWL